ncbi:MAG: cAMP-binding protein [Rhodospirillaceae bacterium]|nr:cAMP-binding protein [Rhodospirillaceae bacterium]HAA92122.1 cAMP-binding protein [Rhodospirillaceae bacterium]
MPSDDRVKVLDRKSIPAGTQIFREGDPGRNAFIVQSGEVEIWKGNDNEKRRLGLVTKGGIFGEMALVDDTPRMASATTVTDCVLVAVSEKSFQEKLDRSDPFVVALLRIFARNIRAMTK